MQDVTAEAPARRMAVVRGAITPVPVWPPEPRRWGAAEAIAEVAAKHASGVLVGAAPQITHVHLEAGDKGSCTLTVQAWSRGPVMPTARLALAAVLACLADEKATWTVEPVQEVVG